MWSFCEKAVSLNSHCVLNCRFGTYVPAIFCGVMGFFLARKTPKLLYYVTKGALLVTTSLVMTLL